MLLEDEGRVKPSGPPMLSLLTLTFISGSPVETSPQMQTEELGTKKQLEQVPQTCPSSFLISDTVMVLAAPSPPKSPLVLSSSSSTETRGTGSHLLGPSPHLCRKDRHICHDVWARTFVNRNKHMKMTDAELPRVTLGLLSSPVPWGPATGYRVLSFRNSDLDGFSLT